uniref:ribonuclease H n=1 Tax=Monopterus albus TaxID=43700 RepID=A0A3Q3JDL1_MONAL
MHCTFNYALCGDENDDYDALWDGFIHRIETSERRNTVDVKKLYVGPEGVSSLVHLPDDLQNLYMLSENSAPQIALLVRGGADAKNLGPMIHSCLKAIDWMCTQNAQLQFSPSTQCYAVEHNSQLTLTLEKCLLNRNHNRENIDHPLTQTLLDRLPPSLWSAGPTDVGLLTVDPVMITLREGAVPLYQAQYPLTQQQVSGIEKTIHGLLEAGVLTPTHSSWNTLIHPVPKAGKPDYRMVHDIRAVNKVVVPTNSVTPNPYTMLNAISSEHKFFTCIDLRNAFFSVPLHRDSQNIFAFMYKGQQFAYRRLPMGFIDSPSIFNHILR